MTSGFTQQSLYYIADREIRGVAFNFEGTCVDVEEAHWAAHLKVLEIATGIDIQLKNDNWNTILQLIPSFVGGPREPVVEEIYRLQFKHKRDIILSREELTKQDSYYYSLYLDKVNISVRTGLREWVGFVRDICGIPVSLGTTTLRHEADFILKRSGLFAVFSPNQIVFGKKRDLPDKPKPDIYLATAELMGIDPKYQLVMGDSFTSDAPAAKTAGSPFVAVPTIDTARIRKKFYKAGALAVYPEWNDITLFGYQLYLRSKTFQTPLGGDIYSK